MNKICNKRYPKDDILICKNYNVEVKSEEKQTFIFYKKVFKSKVNIYYKLEFKEINYEVKNVLLYKKRHNK